MRTPALLPVVSALFCSVAAGCGGHTPNAGTHAAAVPTGLAKYGYCDRAEEGGAITIGEPGRSLTLAAGDCLLYEVQTSTDDDMFRMVAQVPDGAVDIFIDQDRNFTTGIPLSLPDNPFIFTSVVTPAQSGTGTYYVAVSAKTDAQNISLYSQRNHYFYYDHQDCLDHYFDGGVLAANATPLGSFILTEECVVYAFDAVANSSYQIALNNLDYYADFKAISSDIAFATASNLPETVSSGSRTGGPFTAAQTQRYYVLVTGSLDNAATYDLAVELLP